MTIKQAVVFAILMENSDGIIGKAPSYIEEKLKSCERMDNPEGLLDSNNTEKLRIWKKRWEKPKK